jgi:homogentisate phytyltransferase / homogentisate geranylgeranyltransferase
MTATAAAVAPARAAAGVLWRFSRPHTIVGTTVSIAGLFTIVVAQLPAVHAGTAAFHLFWTLVAGASVNVFIVGVNQISDVEIDRVNKPFLPIAAGDLTKERATWIVAAAGALPVVLALTQGPLELAAVIAALAVGAAYSLPPARLKRHPAIASLCVSGVRSAIVNLGVAAHFTAALSSDGPYIPDAVWALTAFVLPFSLAIAILKDVPDAEGDRRHAIHTFTVRHGGRAVMRAGLAVLTLAYLGMAIAGPLLVDDAQPLVLSTTHLAALALLGFAARNVDPGDRAQFTTFYLRVWQLFFLEYAIVPVSCLAI